MQCHGARATKWMAVSAFCNGVTAWRDNVTAWRNGVSLTCDDVTARRNSVSVTCNDVTAKRTDTISRLEHVHSSSVSGASPSGSGARSGSTEAVDLPLGRSAPANTRSARATVSMMEVPDLTLSFPPRADRPFTHDRPIVGITTLRGGLCGADLSGRSSKHGDGPN